MLTINTTISPYFGYMQLHRNLTDPATYEKWAQHNLEHPTPITPERVEEIRQAAVEHKSTVRVIRVWQERTAGLSRHQLR